MVLLLGLLIIILIMSNRLQAGSMPSPTYIDSLRASHPSSTHSHKPSSLFLTQKRQQAHEAQILQRHAQLNGYIEELDLKVQRIVQHNQAQLLFAYKNHLESVRAEMLEFKEETHQALQGEAINMEKIAIMEKQLIVFREEALKLFQKGMKKDKEIEQLQMRVQEFMSEKEHMDSTVKALIKRNKELEAIVKSNEERMRMRQDGDILGRVQVNSFVSLGISSHKKNITRDRRMKDRILSKASHSHVNSKSFTQDHFHTQQPTKEHQPQPTGKFLTPDAQLFARSLKLKLSYIEPKVLQSVVESAVEIYTFFQHRSGGLLKGSRKETYEARQTKSSLKSRSFHTRDSNSKMSRSISRQNRPQVVTEAPPDSIGLKDCFRQCVQVVRKEIARRKNLNTLNFFKEGCPISLEDFRNVDFLKLMELVFSNEKLIHVVYWSLFNQGK